ncbi:MAG TPA: hypothetical protein VMY35_00305 [Phycisphaerae bacterium]|nr:hypothetical protein [Phycisphaerae bacterium]
MPAVLTYADHEAKPARRTRDVEIGYIWTRVYTLPVAGADSLRPARGALLAGESGLLGARVLSATMGAPGKDAMVPMTIEAIKPVAYTSGLSGTHYVEVRGSRRGGQRGPMKSGMIICLSDDQSGIPNEGDLWPSQTGVEALRCFGTDNSDYTTVPGLYLCRAYYTAYVEYGT